jgi:hypothetical protein
MRYLVAAATIALLTVPAQAETMKNCGAAWTAKTPAATAAGSYSAWSKTCMAKGHMVPAAALAAMSAAPVGATGQ